ncbi:hypothetical protein PACTADRAFT_52872 [Pachysolen tannophilus NRRL Y-2460]|uniref:AMP-dependent synthetase/ligase domain-containing protein n=1 Tax=Pachysolen tannophilus NRRL Y-2460 TaxID=669874 RepID=A0A1E4U1G8_PACTA|nr:hypothetical protein PACTADRAFT_52872 [Pachysolen tannophilus NRRL Y-2460]
MNGGKNQVCSTILPQVKTFFEFLDRAMEFYGNKDCLGFRKFNEDTGKFDNFFTFQSYKTVFKRKKDIGSGLCKVLNNVQDKFILTLYSPNRAEWILTDLACHSYDIPTTALYDTLGQNASVHILQITKSPIVVCPKDKLLKISTLKKKHPQELKNLSIVVSMDDLKPKEIGNFQEIFNNLGMKLFDLKTVEKLGEETPIPYIPPSPDGLYSICFTSGTTGAPKGAELTHKGLMAGMTFYLSKLEKPKSHLKNGALYSLCFLPLAHIFEKMGSYYCLASGIAIGFPHDNSPLKLLENLRILKPNLLVAVPRLYTKFELALKQYISQNDQLARFVERKLLASKQNQQLLAAEDNLDLYITAELRRLLGFDNMDLLVTGSAPISPQTVFFLKTVLNTNIVQGYGCTETFAGLCLSSKTEPAPFSCGYPGCTVQFRLKDVEEMGYRSSNDDNFEELDEPRGELLIRGSQVFENYFKNKLATKEAIDEKNWYHTGDIAKIDKDGKIHIIDRVKNFFKLAQGEFITPERIENVYLSSCPMLSQMFIHGDSKHDYLVSIIGVEHPFLHKILKHETPIDLNSINKDKKIKKFIVEELNKHVGDKGLHSFEKIHNTYIAHEPLKLENNVITPTLKIRRNIAKKFFAQILQGLYSEGSLIKDGSSNKL